MKPEHEKPDLYMFLCEGGFSAQLSATNTFNRVQIDEILEETVNRDTQTAGGTKGFSLNPAAVSRYYLTAELPVYIEKLPGTPTN